MKHKYLFNILNEDPKWNTDYGCVRCGLNWRFDRFVLKYRYMLGKRFLADNFCRQERFKIAKCNSAIQAKGLAEGILKIIKEIEEIK